MDTPKGAGRPIVLRQGPSADNVTEDTMADETRQASRQVLRDYKRVGAAIRYLEAHVREQPVLSEVAAAVNMSEFHFQRSFRRWAGISPKRFLQYLTVGYAKDALNESQSVLDTAFDVGLSGPSRLHDLFVSCEAMTPGEYKELGSGLVIRYGFHPTPFGECLLFVTERGICGLAFVEDDRDASLQNLGAQWSLATHLHDQAATAPFAEQIFGEGLAQDVPLRLVLKGTNFQVRVWEALMCIPPGHVTSYEALGAYLGKPKASRAIGSAVGRNSISYLVPCHRVIHKSGLVTGYRWGHIRKRALLGWEAARHAEEVQSAA
tara:strand:+ start:9032 stop:9991 length:960 start_codon:yes stop_codon:yes gene_type:complete